jgi:hypothetical protein
MYGTKPECDLQTLERNDSKQLKNSLPKAIFCVHEHAYILL